MANAALTVTVFLLLLKNGCEGISDKPVVIENAQAGCGCTTPEWSREPIAPNSTSKIKVGYNAAAPGTFTKQVTVKLAGVDATKAITITGEVVAGESAGVAAATPEVKADVKPVAKETAPVKTTKSATKTEKKSTKKTTTSSK